jgi:PAS domain S-box-containing protein
VFFEPFFRAAEAKGVAKEKLVDGVGHSVAELRKVRRRVGWPVLCRFMVNASTHFTDAELRAIGHDVLRIRYRRYPRVARALFTPADVYALVGRSDHARRDRALISCIDRYGWEVSPERFVIEFTMEDGYPSCPELFPVTRGLFEAVPTLLGLPPAPVELEVSSHGALFHVDLPAHDGFLTRFRRSRRKLHTMRVAVDELQAAHTLLNRQNEDLKKTHATLRESEARFRALIENSSDFILLMDAGGRVVYLSPSAERITGYEPANLSGKLHAELAHPDDRAELSRALEALAVGNDGTAVRFRFHTQKGAWIWLEGTAKNMLADPRVRAILINYRDVTDRIRLEEQLLQSRKLESIGRLAGGIAHDFNNLLTGVLGNAQLVLMRADTQANVRERVEQIEEYARRAADLTSQLLAFARKRLVQPRQTDLNDLVLQTRSLLDRLIGDHIEVVTILAAQLGTVEVDPTQVQQVILNLAVNARDAMPNGGKLTLSTYGVEDDAGERYVVLSVADTGHGMDADTMANLFEPFFTTKELGRGTGLGLATSHGIVSQAGGRIEVDSTPDRGTEFCIFLPQARRGTSSPSLKTGVVRTPRGSETLLLVDDEAAVRESTAELLESLGYSVLTAEDGSFALELAAKYPRKIHAVIADVVMPRLSGPSLVEELKKTRPDICCLFISGYGEDGHRALLADGAVLVEKPFDLMALAHALRDLLDTPERKQAAHGR